MCGSSEGSEVLTAEVEGPAVIILPFPGLQRGREILEDDYLLPGEEATPHTASFLSLCRQELASYTAEPRGCRSPSGYQARLKGTC